MEREFTIEGLEDSPLDNDAYRILEPLVMDVAGREWKHSTVFSIDDVAQAIWAHMVANWKHYENQEEGLIRHMARRAARSYAHEQRNAYMYSTGSFVYTPGMVRRYLEDVVWCSPEDCSDIEARADLTEALQKLPRAQKAAVYKKYALREPLVRNAEQVAESRAVSAITSRLNTGLRLKSLPLNEYD